MASSFSDELNGVIDAIHREMGTEQVHYRPPQATGQGYPCERVQWEDSQTDPENVAGGEVTRENARCQVLKEDTPGTMPPPKRGGTIIHNDIEWYVSAVRAFRHGDQVRGWRLRLSRALSENAAPDYHTGF